MKQTLFLIAASAAAVIAQNNTVREVVLDETRQYRLQYNIINETSANPTLNATLSINGFDTSRWTTANGQSGLYLGIGFGG